MNLEIVPNLNKTDIDVTTSIVTENETLNENLKLEAINAELELEPTKEIVFSNTRDVYITSVLSLYYFKYNYANENLHLSQLFNSFLLSNIEFLKKYKQSELMSPKYRPYKKILLRLFRTYKDLKNIIPNYNLDEHSIVYSKFNLQNTLLKQNPFILSQLLIQQYYKIWKLFTLSNLKSKLSLYKKIFKLQFKYPNKHAGLFNNPYKPGDMDILKGLTIDFTNLNIKELINVANRYSHIINGVLLPTLEKPLIMYECEFVYFYINFTHSNSFLTITDSSGNVLQKISAGFRKPRSKKSQRKTTFGAASMTPLLIKMLQHYIISPRYITIIIRLKGYKYKFRDVFKGVWNTILNDLHSKNLEFAVTRKLIRFQNISSLPHNGCRIKRKPRK